MADRDRLEFERIRNLISCFGWKSVKEEMTDTEIIMVLTKPRVDIQGPTTGMPPT